MPATPPECALGAEGRGTPSSLTSPSRRLLVTVIPCWWLTMWVLLSMGCGRSCRRGRGHRMGGQSQGTPSLRWQTPATLSIRVSHQMHCGKLPAPAATQSRGWGPGSWDRAGVRAREGTPGCPQPPCTGCSPGRVQLQGTPQGRGAGHEEGDTPPPHRSPPGAPAPPAPGSPAAGSRRLGEQSHAQPTLPALQQ